MNYQTPHNIEQFRQATAVQELSLINGVEYGYLKYGYWFMCPDCKQSKPMKGRKSRGWRNGFRCSDCAMKKMSPDKV